MVHSDKLREDFARRLAQASKNIGLDDHGRGAAIARALGVTSKATSKWFNAESMPRPDKMAELAKYLRVDLAWLQLGIGEEKNSNQLVAGREAGHKYEYPLFSASSAAEDEKANDDLTNNDSIKWISSTIQASPRGFWMVVKNDSMVVNNAKPSFPEGMLILVDPNEEVIPGDFCVAKFDGDTEVTFRKLISEAGEKLLKPLNPAYSIKPFNENCQIIGKVINAIWEL
ncbi:Uncharacterized HTH-type transcriptional regulator CBU_1416 [Serratia quinivorans]|uniref:Uncharacterized HTH-type transcriptional regulator CBU_1416 n=1 Tax=Serratia quinivorans TaxID=137545 RepID=A0A380AHF3_9GAMM|nr:XRE family transcriptional regulator [Serratia proteamaculans]RYM64724.1 hypothetical protein BSR03_04220 [Serratia proteamaculans]SUI81070.1 Uncharacterized HTH-type transcriptional regulator CBU_1416 [Serratia quinivorans]